MSSFYQKLTAESDSSLLLRVSSLQSDAAMFHSGQDCGFRVSKAAHSLFFWIDLYFSLSLVSLTSWARYPKCFDASFVHEKADFLKSRIRGFDATFRMLFSAHKATQNLTGGWQLCSRYLGQRMANKIFTCGRPSSLADDEWAIDAFKCKASKTS